MFPISLRAALGYNHDGFIHGDILRTLTLGLGAQLALDAIMQIQVPSSFLFPYGASLDCVQRELCTLRVPGIHLGEKIE